MRCVRSPASLIFCFALLCAQGCQQPQQAETASPELQALVAKDKPPAGISTAAWADVQKFYAARQHVPAWTAGGAPTARANQALETLRSAESHGFDRATYHEPELSPQHGALAIGEEAETTPERAQQLAEFDVRLTGALLELGRHVATGRLNPSSVDTRWNAKRQPPDYVAALQRAWEADGAGFLDAVRPQHPEYKALQEALTSLHSQSAKGWPKVARASLKVGQWNPTVPALRQRLAASGYLPATASLDSEQYDADVEIAIRAFQEHHGLKATGNLDPPTVTAVNVPLPQRIAQVAMNLERWRWMPDDLGARHFLVNIPYFHLVAREDGKQVLDMRVVVGKRGNETPIFTDEMTHVVLSPYWNIPETIALEETAPALARDPDYLERNNMEVVNAAGRVVPASSIQWGNESALAGLRFRQRPGASNALGFVKFMFPNEHNVYLHDTPADALFSRIGRAFSHGCVRVEEPEVLAQYVLRDQAKWTPETIRTAMRSGEEQHVKLPQPIPVHIVYLTAWVDEKGGLHFQDDVYGYDAKQARAQNRR
jgi:murein L,D-transpeptidase YcbB/YkuD